MDPIGSPAGFRWWEGTHPVAACNEFPGKYGDMSPICSFWSCLQRTIAFLTISLMICQTSIACWVMVWNHNFQELKWNTWFSDDGDGCSSLVIECEAWHIFFLHRESVQNLCLFLCAIQNLCVSGFGHKRALTRDLALRLWKPWSFHKRPSDLAHWWYRCPMSSHWSIRSILWVHILHGLLFAWLQPLRSGRQDGGWMPVAVLWKSLVYLLRLCWEGRWQDPWAQNLLAEQRQWRSEWRRWPGMGPHQQLPLLRGHQTRLPLYDADREERPDFAWPGPSSFFLGGKNQGETGDGPSLSLSLDSEGWDGLRMYMSLLLFAAFGNARPWGKWPLFSGLLWFLPCVTRLSLSGAGCGYSPHTVTLW